MKTIKTRGLVIRSLDYKDTSKIVYLLSPYGILSIKALGVKKYKNKNYNFYEPLTYVQVEITDSSFPNLVEYSVVDGFIDIKSDFEKFFAYAYFMEFLNRLPSDIPFEKTLDFALNTIKLGRLYNPLLLILMFQIKVLPLFGIKPDLKKCGYCLNKPQFLDINSGLSLCKIHNHIGTVLINDILLLYYFDLKKDDYSILTNIDLKFILDFVTNYYLYHADIKLKSLSSLIIK